MTLLGPDDPAPVRVTNPAGGSRYVLIGDHAGRRFPATLGDMGIAPADAARHIAWDIGVAALGQALADRIDAVFIEQRYSRLVVDCNRGPDEASAIPPVSDGTAIPANHDLSAADRAARFAEVHEPYQRAVGAELARRDALGRQGIVVALHSFTPVMNGQARPWQVGILHDGGDPSFALACLDWLRRRGGLTVGDNEPYRMDQVDHTITRHCFATRRPYVEIEVRQDLIADEAGVATWVDLIATMLAEA
jgi:predicted N-formylglutamate amidohydrolase